MFQVPESVEILLALTSDPAPVCLLALKILRNLSFHSGNRPRFLCDGTTTTFPSNISLFLLSRWLKCNLCMFFFAFYSNFYSNPRFKTTELKRTGRIGSCGSYLVGSYCEFGNCLAYIISLSLLVLIILIVAKILLKGFLENVQS